MSEHKKRRGHNLRQIRALTSVQNEYMLRVGISSEWSNKMIHKTAIMLKALAFYTSADPATIGEVAKSSKYSKSTVRRLLQQLCNWGYVSSDKVDYKSTGKNVYWMTDEGRIWLSDYRSFPF